MNKSCRTCGAGFSFGVPFDHRDGCPKEKPASLGEYLAMSTEDKMKLFRARKKRERRASRGMTGIEVVIVMALLSLVSAGMMRTESKVRATNRENSLLRYDRKSAWCEPSGWLWRDTECSEPKLLDWCPEVRFCTPTPKATP